MTFFDDIISNNTIRNMKRLTDNFDTFNMGIKQMLNFQFLLFDCLNDLGAKYVSLKSDVNLFNSQLNNVDDVVQSYLTNNKITVTTRDGVPIDDAIIAINDKISNIYHRLDSYHDRTQKLEIVSDDSVRKSEFRILKQELDQNSHETSETSKGIQLLQKELDGQKTYLDEKWELMKGLFQTTKEDITKTIDEKMPIEGMVSYAKHNELSELITFISELPQEKRVRIPKIIPQVFLDSSTTMEEKLKKAYDLLMIERSRLDLEDSQLVQEFTQLKQLAKMHFQDPSIEAQYKDVMVADIATDSGYSDRSAERHLVFNRGYPHSGIATNFHGPDDCEAERETPFEILIDQLIASRKGGSGNMDIDTDELKENVLKDVQKHVEVQMTTLMKELGVNINQDDIHQLVNELRAVEEVKDDINGLKVKLQLKVDQSIIFQELEKYLKREEFFDMLEAQPTTSRTSRRPTSTLTKVRVKQNLPPATSRRQKPEVKSPAMLVPSRNSKLLGVNDKYLIGDDGKTYLKESSRVSDKSYKEPPITGTGSGRVSYYDRSKMTMEIDGVDAVIDFQPFVPVDGTKKHQSDESD
ncbi:hypothetical protein TRFO_20048 [Tritrichomonas foetus]|uniref:Uncharacterized protein n=1 Tax=Tritrichomonas foetus TaxID=1144522 RepID=A0A1J4KGR4_9EUKA|nr:hypothetical protein TRFO_20048 [Tritrichomonas foetus]|eukprot:OHT10561.1 hypothetical protein TRFO_20048 [Tritrichomonas foetus]